MKNRHIIITVLAVFIVGIIAGAFSLTDESKAFSVGKCLLYEDDTIIFLDGMTPILAVDKTKQGNLFSALSDGDELLLLHDGIEETYPARTGAYFVLRLKNGRKSDLPKETLQALAELGYIKQ